MKTIFFLFTIIIFLFSAGKIDAQTFAVSGYIKNQYTGKAIKHASVFEEMEGVGTISNSKGFYKLLLNPGDKSIKISDSGFQTISTNFQLAQDTVLMVMLKPEKPQKPVQLESVKLEKSVAQKAAEK